MLILLGRATNGYEWLRMTTIDDLQTIIDQGNQLWMVIDEDMP